MSRHSETIQSRPLIITVGIHALLLLVLILWRYTLPAATVTVPDMGMEVNLGTSADGSGTDQPMDIEDPAAAASESRNTAGAQSAANDVESSDEDDAPSIASAPVRSTSPSRSTQDSRRPTTATNNAPTSNRPQTARRPTYVYEGATGQGGNGANANVNGSSEGNTSGSGDRGVPYGTPGATNYTGTPGSGTGGIALNLSGRNLVVYPPRNERYKSKGKVTVSLTVNREGEIVGKRVTKSNNSELSALALRMLAKTRFNKSLSAPPEQFGSITLEFNTGQ